MWAARSMHVFSAVVWLGGLLYMGGIFYPVIRYEEMTASPAYIRIERRFTGFVWMCVWTSVITGAFLMLFSPRFVFGRFHDEWDFLLLAKEIIYVLMVGTAAAGTSVVKEMESVAASPSTDEMKRELAVQHQRMLRGRRTSLALGIIVLLVAVRMVMV